MDTSNAHMKHSLSAVNAALSVMLCLVLALFAYISWDQRGDELRNGLTTAGSHVQSVESDLTQSLRIIELSATNFEVHAQLGIDWDEVSPRLLDAVRAAPFLRSLSIADVNGVIVASSTVADLGESIELGSLFPQADAAVQVLRVGPPQTGRDWSSRPSEPESPNWTGNGASPMFVPVVMPMPSSHTTYWLVAALNPDLFINQATHKLDAKKQPRDLAALRRAAAVGI